MPGADAGTRHQLLFLGPAQPPLACPLAPTGGDALRVSSIEWGRIGYLATTLNNPISVGGILE